MNHTLTPAQTIPPEHSLSGHEQHEKTCSICGAVRVTIVDGESIKRAWRLKDDPEQRPFEPLCPGMAKRSDAA
jgi:hypothetical protein